MRNFAIGGFERARPRGRVVKLAGEPRAIAAERVDLVGKRLLAAISLAPRAAPAQVTVKLPPTDRDQARATLTDLSAQWGFDESTVRDWYEDPRSAGMDHAYSTRVFRGQPVGFVRPEFQVEHHVRSDHYIVDTIFSWDV